MRRIRRRLRRPSNRASSQRPEAAHETQQIVMATATLEEPTIKAPPSHEIGISVTLVGPVEWLIPLVKWLEYEPDMTLSAENPA